ncbi:sodium-dependent transporter bedraggled isoform X2 [Cylas formicarius]|uniref:sodium-dependent transporter bedraggled isoform X2 n=1 Tax=Cylas formicarius TaxID=197179 RepID=UPI002958CFCC|nr:sodium-dependent transporter bedraggled isoform X2 [Cylas formicarius]
MSSETPGSPDDLIDFRVDSPVLPRTASLSDVTVDTDNLIDTDLPVFERKLQTASAVAELPRKPPVGVEDILISIEDADVDCVSEEFLNLSQDEEALQVLKNLDALLDETLTDECDAQRVIDECLQDLDNYLRTIEDDSDGESAVGSPTVEDFDEEAERSRLRRIEENYGKFLASGGTDRRSCDGELRRTRSCCAVRAETSPSSAPGRATVTVVKRERAQLQRRKSSSTTGLAGTSGTRGVSLDQLRLDRERLAHNSSDCFTGTVVVEQPPSRDGTTWLRSSMRRLEHLDFQAEPAAAAPELAVSSVRPVSAPSRLPLSVERARSRSRESRVSGEPTGRARSSSASSRSRPPRSLSSSVSSLASSVESALSQARVEPPARQSGEAQAGGHRRPCDRPRQTDMPEVESPLGQWPHSLSSMMACLGCTLGLFNISRFAILTVHFGANFIFQFFLLSMVFGLPLFSLQLCLGQQLGAGVIDMWRISPLFQGVGVSLLIAQALTGLYSIVGVSWMFVFFRDSFITRVDKYRWAEPFLYYRHDLHRLHNATYRLTETVPDYFNGIVLQRHHFASGTAYATVKFQPAFNLAVVWMIVFVSLSKGLRSYGKVIYAFVLFPVFGTFVLCAKILGLMPPELVNVIFPETSWTEFFLNPKSWLAAAQETFLTWGLLGAAVMQVASHNKHKHLLQRDCSLVAVITFTVLLLVAFLANTCVQILKSYGYSYFPSSFEHMSSSVFLRSARDPLPPSLANTPVRYMIHNSFILGERVIRPGVDYSTESGYQALRLATELLPATFAVMGAEQVSPFWAVLFYFILIMFGVSQQLAIWHCVITGIMAIRSKVLKSWETTITFFSCTCGFILGLPMATEVGIYVVYFMDYVMGGIWWMTIIVLLQIVAVFVVRGRPYSGDTVVTALFGPTSACLVSWAPPLLSFTWNVILPVVLMVLCISTFRNGYFRDMFVWHHAPVAEYWPLWSRQMGSMMQLLPVLCVPLVAVVQSYRYLNSGPSDILDDQCAEPSIHRIQLLYRPPIGEHMEEPPPSNPSDSSATSPNPSNVIAEDPPPKYTPPPSYTTATGARLAKFLRQSIRRSVRRIATILGESSGHRQPVSQPPPPDYNTVLVEMASTTTSDTSLTVSDSPARVSTLERLRGLESTSNALTAAEVASILRSSFRRSKIVKTQGRGSDVAASLSDERLVDAAAPMAVTSLVLEGKRDDNPPSVI